MANRKKAEALIMQFVGELDASGYNTEMYKKILAEMTDETFRSWMEKIRNEGAGLVLFKPAFQAKGINTERNLQLAEKYGIPFFERLAVTGKQDVPDYLTPIEHLILHLPTRRQSQNLMKKIKIPSKDNVIDDLTGQVTGDSKGARISHTSLQVLNGMGMDESLTELFKVRGGDRGAHNAYQRMMATYGRVSLKALEPYATGVESTKSLKAILLAMHIKSTL